MSQIATVRNDPQYKQFKLHFSKIQANIDIESIINESMALHNSRTSTQIKDNKGQFSPQALMDANAIDLSNRSRLAFLAANLQLKLSKLDSLISAIDNYIYTKYCSDWFRTVDEKKKFVKRVLKNYIAFYEQGTSALEFIAALMKDIDQSGFALRNMVDCLKLLSETKGKII